MVRVNVVLHRTVVADSDWRFDNLYCAVVIFRVKASWRETTHFSVEVWTVSDKKREKMVTWYKFTLAVCRKQDLNLSMIDIPSEKKNLY